MSMHDAGPKATPPASRRGTTVPADFDPKVLHALKPEGFYRVTREFFCCAKKCTKFETDTFVQLGYNGNATPLVFMPQVGANGISIPDRGSVVDENTLANLQPMKLAARSPKKTWNTKL